MNLEDFVGKQVLVVFKGNMHLYIADLDGDRVVPFFVSTQEGKTPIPLPFISGEIVKLGSSYAVQWSARDVLGPQGKASLVLQSFLNPDVIASVTLATEKRVSIIGG